MCQEGIRAPWVSLEAGVLRRWDVWLCVLLVGRVSCQRQAVCCDGCLQGAVLRGAAGRVR
jgi:hypothetical protein